MSAGVALTSSGTSERPNRIARAEVEVQLRAYLTGSQ